MLRPYLRPYLTATRYGLLELARNRLALGLLLLFVPIWFALFGAVINGDPVPFKFNPTGELLQANGHNMVVLTAGFNALTLIVGFLMFSATRKGAAFDRRLVLCGYAKPVLMLAKLTALVVAAAFVALYTSLVLFAFWQPRALPLVWAGYMLAALAYGGLGLLLGVLMRSELAGFFLIIMVSLLDTTFQSPVENPVANARWLKAFPAYGPMQIAVAGGFTSVAPWTLWRELLFSLAWSAGFALVGLLIFWWRTHAWNARGRVPLAPAQSSVALVA
jgi:hypothetical protein